MRTFVVLALIASCGKGDPEDQQEPADTVALVGAFQVGVEAPSSASAGFVSVFGRLYDGPTPQPVVWDEEDSSGDCLLLVPRNPYCSATCPDGSICAADEECVAYPSVLVAGTVTVHGVETGSGSDSFTMNPIAGNYQPSEALAYPAFAAGDSIGIEAAGSADFETFSLAAKGVGELAWTGGTPTLEHGTAVNLTWTAATAGDSDVHVKLDISHHGGTKGKIECVTDDDGSLQLGATLVGELLDLGYAGFPTVIVTRRSTGSATTALGRVDLVVSSAVEKEVDIPGLDSCNEDADCPANKSTCLLPDRVCTQ